MASVLKYQALADPQDSFRLIELLPASSDEAIHCLLKEFKLSQSPQYEALSYEWGTPLDLDWVTVNGCQYQLRRNLHSALVQLRPAKTDSKRKLFVDAICINQDDMEERSTQVQLMGEIYKKAASVLVWLGQADNDSDLLLD